MVRGERAAKPGDLIAVLSNGGFGGFISKLIARLKAVYDQDYGLLMFTSPVDMHEVF